MKIYGRVVTSGKEDWGIENFRVTNCPSLAVTEELAGHWTCNWDTSV